MYVKNPEKIPKYGCTRVVANWLIYQQHLPLLGRDGKIWYFAQTKDLEEALKRLPFWLNVVSKF